LTNLISNLKNSLSFSNTDNSSLETYNIYSSTLYKVNSNSKENKFTPIKHSKQKYNKNSKTLSFLSNSDFSFDTIDINRNIPDDEIEDAIYNIVYEELDNSLNYSIMFEELKNSDEKSEFRSFNVFIINPNIIKYISMTISQNIKYIDNIYPLPILFKSLYKFANIYDRTECFIYTYRDGTSLNLFINGELIYSKSLNFSILLFFDTFRELYENIFEVKLLYADFKLIVTDVSKFNKNIKFRKMLTTSLKIFFDEVDDVTNYIKRNFNIESFDNLYYYSKIGKILGVSEYSQTIIEEESFDGFLSEFSINFPNHLDETHYLLYLTDQLNKDVNIYIDILKAPPSLFLRPSGQIFIITFGSIFLSLAYPFFNYYQTSQIDSKLQIKRIEHKELHSQFIKRVDVLKHLNNQIGNLKLKESNLKSKYQKKLDLINSIFNQRTKYTMKGEEIVKLTRVLNIYNVSISSIKYRKDEVDQYFQIGLIAKYEKDITYLLRSLVKDYSLFTESIEIDTLNHIYKSELKILDKIDD